jgi:hypothetical protein
LLHSSIYQFNGIEYNVIQGLTFWLTAKETAMLNANQNAPAPDFSATDSEGKIIQLSGYKGKKKVVLVFNRGFF